MKKIFFFILPLLIMPLLCQAHVLEEAWEKYSGIARDNPATPEVAMPGKVYGADQGQGESSFDYPWKYRQRVFEVHYDDPEKLARGIYSLALFTRDINPDLPRGKFYSGVLGFHYSSAQLAAWLNHILQTGETLTPDESAFAGMMLEHGVIRLGTAGFEPGQTLEHALGAAPGKKRSFEKNLRHERLHVFWDEDEAWRKAEQAAWAALGDDERQKARVALKNYARDNEAQLVEEWAVKRAENSDMPIK